MKPQADRGEHRASGAGVREPGEGERRACVVTSWSVCELHLVGTSGTAARDPLSSEKIQVNHKRHLGSLQN